MPAAQIERPHATPLRLPCDPASDRGGRSRTSGRSAAEKLYFAGPENRAIATATTRLIDAASTRQNAPTVPSPTALIGPPGSGKTTLLGGIVSAWSARHGVDEVLQTTAVDLRRRLEHTLASERKRPGVVASFEQRLAELHMLAIEDLEGLADSPHTIDLVTRSIDRIISSGGQVLVTASRPLSEIAGLTPRIVGRLSSGLTLEVAAPAEAARESLLVNAMQDLGRSIDPIAAMEIAAELPADARRVLALAEGLAQRFPASRPVGRAEARLFLAEQNDPNHSTPLAEIANVVARYYSMPLRQLRSSSRKAPVVLARSVAIYLIRQLTPMSYEEIGRYFGGRDHTTVMHNFNRVNSRAVKDRALRSALDDLLRKLGRPELANGSIVAPGERTP